jgi:hypothetical protein
MSVSSDEKSLVLRAKKGDIFAFEKLFKVYYRNLCLFAEYYVREKSMAEEIVTGFFLKLWEKRKTIEVRDLWKHKNIGTTATELSASIGGHNVLMVRLTVVGK